MMNIRATAGAARNQHAPRMFVGLRSRQQQSFKHVRAAADIAENKVEARPKPAKAAKQQGSFTNKQTFVVPADAQPAFERAWDARRSFMEVANGFEGFRIERSGDEFTIVSQWRSIPEWEALNLSKPYRRSHLPSGIWQRVPKPGEGFPEDFVPFVDMNTFVQARY